MSVNINFPNFIEVNALDTSDATATENDIAVGKSLILENATWYVPSSFI